MTKQHQSAHSRAYLPAAGHDLFLPLYDPLTRLIGIGRLRRKLIEQANLRSGQHVLDVGCGTGSLLLELTRLYPGVIATGVDPDPRALERARRKAERARAPVRLQHGFGDALEFPDASFERVMSSFMFHHLNADKQLGTLTEVHRVLKPGGRLELVDLAGSEARGSHGLHRWLHANERLAGNDRARVLTLLQQAGFAEQRVTEQHKHVFGTIVFYQAARSATP